MKTIDNAVLAFYEEGREYNRLRTDIGLGSSHLHTAKALKAELKVGGFSDSVVHGTMGGAWLANNIDELWKNEKSRNILMTTVRLLDTHDEIIGLSCHLLAVSKRI